jgi:large subunit ribosomal protein L18
VDKKPSRLRRARRGRAKIRELGEYRLTVHRTPRHIYAQVVKPNGSEILVSASTLDAEVKGLLKGYSGNAAAAAIVGRKVAERARAAGLTRVAFDRAGYKYHGRIKALADAAREQGLEF